LLLAEIGAWPSQGDDEIVVPQRVVLDESHRFSQR
jgi:hypothetical protein